MFNVKKRDGSLVDFDLKKIKDAIEKAFQATKMPYVPDIIETLSLKAVNAFSDKVKDGSVTVEEIQDAVEKTLGETFPDVAKAYILYRKQHENARNVANTVLDYKNLVEGYVNSVDWRVKENSTVTYSLGGLILGNSGAVTANYWLSEIYDQEIAEAHRSAAMHLHDLSMLSGYCFTGDTRVKTLDGNNYSFKEMVEKGINNLWIYAYDLENQKIVPAKAINPRITRKVDKLIKITTCGGKEILCTEDHPFLLRDGTYCKAKNLRPNTSVMPLYVGENNPRYNFINQVWYGDGKKKGYVHRWVAEQMLGRKLEQNEVVHHIDGNKKNNSPENLEVIDDVTHRSMEILKTMSTEKWKEANKISVTNRNKSDEMRNVVSSFAKNRIRNVDGTFASFAYNENVDVNHEAYNHSVRKVETIYLDTPVDVYDMTVPGFENFALDAGIFVHNCAGWSLKQLIQEGIAGVGGRISSKPASHLSTLCNQMVNFLGIMQNEWAGAQAFSSFDTYLAPFVKADNLDYKEVKQCIQSFIYGVNTPSRWGTQAPFTNVTLDWTVPEDLAELNCVVGGKEVDFKYKDCKKEMDMVNKAFIEIMMEGDADGRGFQYPIPTYSITRDFDWSETENNKLLFGMTAKYGTPYFSNYVNSDMKPSDIRSMCPLHKNEKVLVMDDNSGEFHVSIVENLYNGNKKNKEYSILLNGEVKRAVLNRFDNLEFRKIKLINGHEIVLSTNHLNLVYGNKIKRTDELTTKDYLPFNLTPYIGENMTYNQGYMIGTFLGDGSLKDEYSITLSLNNTTKVGVMANVISIAQKEFGAKASIHNIGDNCVNVTLTSNMLRSLIEDYVTGKALDKDLNIKCINRSLDFRKGIIDGLVDTDGTRAKSRIYTSSEKLKNSICTVLASMGLPTRVTVDDRKASDGGKYSDTSIYCVKYYQPTCQNAYGDIYKKADGYQWFKIETIEKLPATYISSIGYCFEVIDDDEPYFMLPSGLVTHNCRLRLDLTELRRKNGGFFGSGESTGSIGVVTLNMPRLAYLAENEEDFYKRLDHLMDVAARSLDTKRKVVSNLLDNGLYPYTKRYLGSFDNHFSTIGLVGMNEACLNAKWLRKDLTDPDAQKFTKDVLNHMRERLVKYQEMYGCLFNLEATPAESTAYRLAKKDKELYPDIIVATEGSGDPFYTNSSHLPVSFTQDVFAALDIQDELQTLYTSGTVFHCFLGEKLPDWKAAANLVKKISDNYKLPYYTMSPTYSICPDHGYITGEHFTCPTCGKKTEVWSRITGYYRPVQNWNNGKVQEFKQRNEYDPAESTEPKAGVRNEQPEVKTEEPEKAIPEGVILYTSPTCVNCRMAEAKMTEKGIDFEERSAADPKYQQEIVDLGIMAAPTLVKDGVIYSGAGEVLNLIDSL
ncbi:MAG: HNH endonuclease [Erysipelotrichaceae bacterium]|nr:HNH endonuclease [Erysipelotrichaceae bacterium]